MFRQYPWENWYLKTTKCENKHKGLNDSVVSDIKLFTHLLVIHLISVPDNKSWVPREDDAVVHRHLQYYGDHGVFTWLRLTEMIDCTTLI